MKVLITGANGYLGTGITKKVLDCGHQVTAVGNKIDRIDPRAYLVKKNIFDIDKPYEYLGEPDILLHLAWKDGFDHNNQSHINNLPLHVNFLDSFFKSNIKDIVIMGSMHEIGFFEGSINEDTPCNPLSCYGMAKNLLREYCFMMAKKYDKTLRWLRGFYIVGNQIYGNSIFSKLIIANSKHEKNFPFTFGTNQFDFLDYDVFCEYVAKATVQNNINGIINVCSGRPEKLSSKVEKFIKENGLKIELQYGAFPDRPYDSKAVWGDNKKILKIVNE